MKELKVTGMAQENDFENGDEIQYLLVLNKGELRIPVSQESAFALLKMLHSNGHNEREPAETTSGGEDDLAAAADEDFGTPPDDEPPPSSDDVTDEDGVGQI